MLKNERKGKVCFRFSYFVFRVSFTKQALPLCHMKNKGLWFLAGFLLFVTGVVSLILQMVGVNLAFLSFLEWPGRLFAFVAKLVMALSGVFIVIMANTDWEKEYKESSMPE
jgi:hypothetical protein